MTLVEQATGKVAVIGSFRQHYATVLAAISVFRDAGWQITSPVGAPIVEPGIDFVRFTTDDAELSDAEVQALTLVRIFSADLTYVIPRMAMSVGRPAMK